MKVNESVFDRILRIIAGAVLLVLGIGGSVITGVLAIVFVVIGAVLVITGAVGFCPLYALLKVSTNKAESKA